MNQINKCESCNNVYSHRQSLWRHKQNCNNKRIRADNASKSINPNQQQSIHNQQHNKTVVNPKISALLTDAIVDDELFPPRDDLTPKVDDNEDIADTDTDDNERKVDDNEDITDTDTDDNERKVDNNEDITDTDTDNNEREDGSDDSDDNKSYSGIEPVNMTGEDADGDEDENKEEEDKDEDEAMEEEEEEEEDEDGSFLQKIERNLKEKTSKIDENKLYNIIFDIVKYLSPIEKIINEIETLDENISKAQLLRFMILLNDFKRNHIRVTDIVNMMDRALSQNKS